MEQRTLNFEAPLLSVRRISTKPELSGESEMKNNESQTMVLSSCPNTERALVPFCLPDRSFDHLTEPASVPFVWEQIPGRPKDVIGSENLNEELIEKNNVETELEQREQDEDDDDDDEDESYTNALDMVSLNHSFSVNCSVSGVSECEKDEYDEEESGKFCEGISEYRDLMMSRFLPAAKAMALKQPQSQSQSQEQYRISSSSEKKKQMRQNREATVLVPERTRLVAKHEPKAVLSHCEDLNNAEDEETDDDDDDDDDDEEVDSDYDHKIYTKVAKKAWRFLPRLCVKNSLSVLNPVLSLRIKTCQNLGKPGNVLQPKPRDSAHKQNMKPQSQSSSPRICRSNRVMNDSSGDQQAMTPSWSSRRLSGFISPYRYPSNRPLVCESGFAGTPEEAEIFRVNQINKATSKSQELYPRTREISGFFKSPLGEKRVSATTLNSPETRTLRNLNSRIQSRIGRIATEHHKHESLMRSYSIQDMKLLAEEAKRRRNNIGSGNVLENSPPKQQSLVAISPPPLPKTPSESWLWRTLPSVTPRNSISNPYVIARFNSEKLRQEMQESTKWETIVKTSYIHHDHNRYSEELIVHPSRQRKT